MKKIIQILFVFLISGCAYIYSPIKIEDGKYTENNDSLGNISILYSQSNMFDISGNKRLLKKSFNKKIHPITLKIINKTDKDINFDSLKIEVFNDFSASSIISQKKSYIKLRQNSALYSLYSIGGLLSFTYSSNGFDYTNPYATIIFPAIAATNFTLAFISNQKLKKDLNEKSLYGKIIPANSEKTGFIFIKADTIKDIKIRVNEN